MANRGLFVTWKAVEAFLALLLTAATSAAAADATSGPVQTSFTYFAQISRDSRFAVANSPPTFQERIELRLPATDSGAQTLREDVPQAPDYRKTLHRLLGRTGLFADYETVASLNTKDVNLECLSAPEL